MSIRRQALLARDALRALGTTRRALADWMRAPGARSALV